MYVIDRSQVDSVKSSLQTSLSPTARKQKKKIHAALRSFSAFLSIMRCLASHWGLHTHTCTCAFCCAKTHLLRPGAQEKADCESAGWFFTPLSLFFCVAAHANEAKRSEMNPLSQRGARGVLQAGGSVREGAWQANAPSVDSFHRTSNGERWGSGGWGCRGVCVCVLGGLLSSVPLVSHFMAFSERGGGR